jgi:hypothetical protein
MSNQLPIDNAPIDNHIYTVRGDRVMLDSDLAAVYEVETKALNQAVNRNPERFPEEFSFQLTQDEWDALRSQIVTSNTGRGGRRYPPRVFTEHGAVTLASVLNSKRAIAASIQVVRAFVRLRHLVSANQELARRIDELNAKFEKRTGEDNVRFAAIFKELKRLALGYDAEEAKPKGRIGYRTSKDKQGDKARAKARKTGK